jgi:TonB family protein
MLRPTLGPGARFQLLPEQRSRAGFMGLSVVIQAVLLGVCLLIPLVFPQKLVPKFAFDVMAIAAPRTDVPMPEKPKVAPPKPKPIEEAKVLPPIQHPKIFAPRIETPKAPPKPVAKVEVPKIAFDPPKVELAPNQPAVPRKPVETGNFGTGSAATPTLKNLPPEKVQTGGFGDPQGIGGPSNPNKHANINRVGSFDLPSGPGYGNGTGGAKGARGTIASTGFGNGTAIPPTAPSSGTHGTVEQGSFSNATVQTEKPKAQQQQQAAVQPVEILEKPRPAYTAEARNLKLEGEVLVSVIFKANGQIQILGVTRGLGHGLDESAIRAAQTIRFKPAISDGRPVDFPATVHIVFQLAY